tara:strand:+ start:1334 stop:3718 length:2385 start_codon:yes stop_codon:yes gene_type:complete
MSLFKGYAQKTNLEGNLLKGEDPSDKILEEGRRYLSQWKDVSQGESESQRRYLEGLERKYQLEKADREMGNNLERYYAGNFKKAIATRNETLINNAKQKQAWNDKRTKELAQFSPKIGNLIKQQAGNMMEAQREMGRNLVFEFGNDWDSIKAVQALDGDIRDHYQKGNSAVVELYKNGASFEQIDQVRRLNFFQRQGVREGRAIKAGEDFRSYQLSEWRTEFDTSRGKISLASATASQNSELLELAQSKIRSAYLNKYDDISDHLVAEHMRPYMIRGEGRVRESMLKDKGKAERAEYQKLRTNRLVVEVKKNGSKGFFDLIQLDAGINNENLSNAKREGFRDLNAAVASGQLSGADAEGILMSKFLPRGEKKEVFVEHRFFKEALEVRQSIAKFDTEEAARLNSQGTLQDAIWKKEARNIQDSIVANYEKLDRKTLNEWYAKAKFQGNTHAQKVILSYIKDPQTEANDKTNIPFLENIESKGLLSRSLVIQQGLSAAEQTKWLKKADAQDPTRAKEAEISFFKSHVKGSIEERLKTQGLGAESKNVASTGAALDSGIAKMTRYFSDGMLQHNGNRELAKQYAQKAFEVDLAKDYNVTLTKTINGVEVKAPHFPAFTVNAELKPYPLSEYTTAKVRENPNISKEELILQPNQVVKFFKDFEHGIYSNYPAEARHFVSKYMGLNPDGTPKMTELQFMVDQMTLLDPKFKLPDLMLEANNQAYKMINPELRRFVTGTHVTKDSVIVAQKFSRMDNENTKRSDKDKELIESYNKPVFTMYRDPKYMSRSAITALGGIQ